MTTLTAHCEKANTGYFGHLKIGSNMVFWSVAVFVTSSIHAIFPFALEKASMNAAKKLASLVQETFQHHEV
jgi:hypothetical protein